MDENRTEDYELSEDEKAKFGRLQEMIKSLYVSKKVSQENLIEAMMNDKKMQMILFSRKYVYSKGNV